MNHHEQTKCKTQSRSGLAINNIQKGLSRYGEGFRAFFKERGINPRKSLNSLELCGFSESIFERKSLHIN